MRSQIWVEVEHIIIDGNSTDNTLDLIAANTTPNTVFKSEKDAGIYDAINKGLALATGDVIGVLNADDVYPSVDILKKVSKIFLEENVDSVYGDLIYFHPDNISTIYRYWKTKEYSPEKIYRGWSPPHPTFFVRRSIFEKYGNYNDSFKLSGDYELMLRLLFKEKISSYYLPEVLVKMQTGGKSNESVKNRFIANIEDRKAWTINELTPKWYSLFLKPLRKLTQFQAFSFPSWQLFKQPTLIKSDVYSD